MKTEKAAALKEALNNLHQAEEKVSNLESRRYELVREHNQAENTIEEARTTLDSATEDAAVTGDDSALKEARNQLAMAKAERNELAEQLKSIGRVIERSKEAVAPALKEAQRQYRLYWLAVEKQEIENAKQAAQFILRAYKAHLNADARSALGLEAYLRGGGMGSGGLLDDLGITASNARDVKFDDDIPQNKPFSRYAQTL